MRTVGIMAVALALLAPALPAQERRVESVELPSRVVDEVVAFFNAPGTIRLEGEARVPAGRRIEGDVAVLGGSLDVAGRIDGGLALINGDLRLRPGARIRGDVTVVGGRVTGAGDAEIVGALTVYRESFRYVRDGEGIARPSRGGGEGEGLSGSLGFGRSRFTVRAGTNYNRVEGLPVMFGPIIETASSNPLKLEALAVWRTDTGLELDTDEMGYSLTLEQFLGGRQLFAVGATAHSLVTPVERWGLTDLESSLATFFLHKDFRDYFDRTGWSVYARAQAPRTPVSLRLEYRDEEHEFVRGGGPWTLKDNDARWRPQALVAQGRLRTVGAALTLDTRNDRDDPTFGWWIQGDVTAGVGGDPSIPGYTVPWFPPGTDAEPPVVPESEPARPVGHGFVTGFLDLRRYNRVSPSAELVLRTALGGSLDGDPLPPQYQHALGGEGSVPGFSLLGIDCGARAEIVSVRGLIDEDGHPVPAFPAYGCDRMALFQAEFRGGFGWEIALGGGDGEWGRAWDWQDGLEIRPRWTAFLNAGRGWIRAGQASLPYAAFDEETRVDAGAGLLLGDLGLYLAVPLNGDDDGVNFFVRLQRRF